MGGESVFRARHEDSEIIIMLGGDDDVEVLDDVDVEVILGDGSRWSATFLSIDAIQRLMVRWKVTGECLNGAFFQCRDLVIVEQRGLAAMIDLAGRLIDTGELQYTFMRID
ncbi:hypothetical protein [Micromonospora sp. NPDC047074]|uniref:hypothetical protein n=1 Tax=Micromonospora sp. NPDC047074 TaxID=3154339 RepID=UPI0033F013F9